MIRRTLEMLSRERYFKRKMPSDFGRREIFLSPDSALQYIKRDWADASMPLLNAARKYVRAGSNVWDIGSNVGVFSLSAGHMAGNAGKVFSVEADPFLAFLFQKTILCTSNKDLSIRVLCAACSDTIGIARFNIAKRGRSCNGLDETGTRSPAGGIRYTQLAPTLTLDSLLQNFERPETVKIDVEGAEALVLRGSQKLLGELRPVFYIEVGAENVHSVTAIFREYQYKLFNGDTEDEVEIEKCVFNTLAVPQELGLTNKGLTTT